MLTVRDLVAGLDVRLLTGEAGVELPVRWVHISELRDPTPWLSGGEVLLTTGMLLEDPAEQRAFVERLSDHQLAALGFGTGFAHAEVPPALVAAAEEHGFPVFEVPYEVPFIAVTEAAFTRLVNEQYAVLRRALAAQERLERIVLSERGLDALAGALASLLGASVLVLDQRGELLASHAFRRELDESAVAALQEEVRERARRAEARVFIPTLADGSTALGLVVSAEEAVGGEDRAPGRIPVAWLLAVKDHGPLTDFDRLTLHQAVTLIALELLRARVAGDTERRLAGDVVAAMAEGELTGVELGRRLEPFGLSDRVSALVVSLCGEAGARRAGELETALRAALRSEPSGGLIAADPGGAVCALLPGLPEAEMLALAERVAGRLGAALHAPGRVGVGRSVPVSDARRSYHEARCALETLGMGQPSRNGGAEGNGGAAPRGFRVAGWRDIGSFQLLLSLQDGEALKLFCDSILEPIEVSEGHYGGELMRSLEAFIEENGQWERAARRLYCHRHTLRYRIRRVEELTGRDLGNARDRIDFWLALRGRELVR